MPLRKCAACDGNLPAGATSRAKYCSAACRQRGHRSKVEPVAPLVLVPGVTKSKPASAPPQHRLSALESAAARLDRLLDEADPRSAAALNKEYRETLRELEAVRAEAQASGGAGEQRGAGSRRAFSASAI